MYFIGSGSLLQRAVKFCVDSNITVDGVICPIGDRSAFILKKFGIDAHEAANPNQNCMEIMSGQCTDGIVFSINNNAILEDSLLSSDLKFYNIHNGLVQKYRGIAEVCVFAAICRCEPLYGATLQRLLPKQKVDSGPIVNQSCFTISETDTFSEVFTKSLDMCQTLFENSLTLVNTGSTVEHYDVVSDKSFTYGDVGNLIRSNMKSSSLARATDLGHYAALLPKLDEAIKLNNVNRDGWVVN